eukprot:Rmarinus@m.5337
MRQRPRTTHTTMRRMSLSARRRQAVQRRSGPQRTSSWRSKGKAMMTRRPLETKTSRRKGLSNRLTPKMTKGAMPAAMCRKTSPRAPRERRTTLAMTPRSGRKRARRARPATEWTMRQARRPRESQMRTASCVWRTAAALEPYPKAILSQRSRWTMARACLTRTTKTETMQMHCLMRMRVGSQVLFPLHSGRRGVLGGRTACVASRP